jgi:murein DD-endopeptidase MepM/ murein hydrolase activator NlpD
VLTDEVAGLTARVRVLEQKLEPLRAEADRLEAERDALRAQLSALTERLRTEEQRLAAAERALAERRRLLGNRLRQLYVRGAPDPVRILVESGSISEAVETQDTLEAIVRRDNALARSVKEYADDVRATRNRIAKVRAEVAAAEERAERAADRANEAKAGLERQQAEVRAVADRRAALLSNVRGDRRHIEAETRGLQRQSEALAAKIRRAQGITSSGSSSNSAPVGTISRTPSAQGFIWPASGTLTSNYGWRWGRMHQGIDIGASTGTPIAAVSSGTVIVAGWNGGYGQLVVVDHGGGVSTAYAHMSAMSVSVGQSVGQGTILGAVGSTGNSTGPHLHFEVRINGAATDPLPYL